jgi:hypothetical protein
VDGHGVQVSMGVQSRAEPACPKSQDQHHELDDAGYLRYISQKYFVFTSLLQIFYGILIFA